MIDSNKVGLYTLGCGEKASEPVDVDQLKQMFYDIYSSDKEYNITINGVSFGADIAQGMIETHIIDTYYYPNSLWEKEYLNCRYDEIEKFSISGPNVTIFKHNGESYEITLYERKEVDLLVCKKNKQESPTGHWGLS